MPPKDPIWPKITPGNLSRGENLLESMASFGWSVGPVAPTKVGDLAVVLYPEGASEDEPLFGEIGEIAGEFSALLGGTKWWHRDHLFKVSRGTKCMTKLASLNVTGRTVEHLRAQGIKVETFPFTRDLRVGDHVVLLDRRLTPVHASGTISCVVSDGGGNRFCAVEESSIWLRLQDIALLT
jgi:hypothetical protein